MRNISNTLLNIMQSEKVVSFLMVKVGPTAAVNGVPSYELLYTTLPYAITDEGDVYSPENGTLQIDPPRLSEILDRDSYTILLADPEFELRGKISNGTFSGTDMIVKAGFLNTTDSPINGAEPGEPVREFLTVYKGFLDNIEYRISPSEEISIKLEGASPMGSLDLTRSLLTSKNYLARKFPDLADTSYDQILIGSQAVSILWGKKERNGGSGGGSGGGGGGGGGAGSGWIPSWDGG